MIKIRISKRTDDYHACIDGDPTRWGCGASLYEAVGALVVLRQEACGVVEIAYDDSMAPKEGK